MVYFTGDIHGFPWNVHKFCKKLKLGKQDILVLLGDVGANYYEDARDENVKAVLSELKPGTEGRSGFRNAIPTCSSLRTVKSLRWKGCGILRSAAHTA